VRVGEDVWFVIFYIVVSRGISSGIGVRNGGDGGVGRWEVPFRVSRILWRRVIGVESLYGSVVAGVPARRVREAFYG
jgi:hypothetical protein